MKYLNKWCCNAVQFSCCNLITLIQLCSFCGRLSQDLAKDLAILAQEIHNVAGDGETQNTASVDEPVSACKEVTFHFSVVFCIFLTFPETFRNCFRLFFKMLLLCSCVLFPLFVLPVVKHAFINGTAWLNTRNCALAFYYGLPIVCITRDRS